MMQTILNKVVPSIQKVYSTFDKRDDKSTDSNMDIRYSSISIDRKIDKNWRYRLCFMSMNGTMLILMKFFM